MRKRISLVHFWRGTADGIFIFFFENLDRKTLALVTKRFVPPALRIDTKRLLTDADAGCVC